MKIITELFFVILFFCSLLQNNSHAQSKYINENTQDIKSDSLFSEKGLIAFYPFNGNANDESGNNNNASVINASLTADRFGNPDNAYYFNGLNNYIEIPNSKSLSSPTKALTICAWINIETFYRNNWAPILAKSVTSDYGMYGLQLTNFPLKKEIEFHFNYRYLNLDFSFELNKWYFIAVIWDSKKEIGNLSYFVNGREYINISNHYSAKLKPDDAPLLIGKDTPELTEHLNGTLDDIRIYNRALSIKEINELYKYIDEDKKLQQ
ncbi:MAG: LamG domain-containing protein [Ignavibacteriae bacterium]|nr:MAG: LamG domain-containing protein [Ignavibacteriota bacterium]